MGVSRLNPSWLRNLPIRRKLSLLVGILALNTVILVAIGILGFEALSSVRAYVGGEGLWAKAQKDAIYSLSKYAVSGRQADYEDYLRRLQVPLGDRRARMALSLPSPDLDEADRGFLQGGNAPEDVRGMDHLILRFGWYPPIRRALAIWAEADADLVELQGLGEGFHAAATRRRPGEAEKAAFIARLDRINGRLTVLENAFSAAMGEAARAAKGLLAWGMVLGSTLVGLLSLAFVLLLSRGIAEGITRISQAASRASKGDLAVRVGADSRDELGRLAGDFNAMVESLARIERLKSEFISNVSHELRTPLTLNLAPLESLMGGDYGPVPAEQMAAMGVMHNNLLRLLQMVNSLLDFSRLEAGRMEVRRTALDAAALVDSVLDDFGPAMEAKKLGLERDLPPAGRSVMMDAYLFERILFNLLSNAVKFTPEGGRVFVGLRVEEGRLRLSVRDNGIGIPPEAARDIFAKFSQAESSATRRFEGTGLGLALVRECSRLLGGDVRLESVEGGGSTFSVDCAAPDAPAGASAAGRVASPWRQLPAAAPLKELVPAAAPGGASPKVLVAEDNPEMSAYIRGLLAPTCEVRVCADGRQALDLVKQWKPELVLSDVMMPGLDGISLTRKLKEDPATGALPVLLLTALTSREALLRGWEAGADDYLFKPFHPKELQARVRTLLALVAWRRRSQRHLQREEILEQFTRIASHDLKAPLRSISVYAGMLIQDAGAALDERGHEYLGVIKASAERMRRMIEGLISYAQLDGGGGTPGVCDLNAVMAGVLEFLEPAVAEAGADVEVGALPSLVAAPGQLFALFQNLVSNALKYRVRDRRVRIRVLAEREEAGWHFRVEDNGRGFNPSEREAIFGLFHRLDGDGEGGVEGHGMGLAIARKVVTDQGGRIWAESEPGRGSTFHFILPDSAAEGGAGQPLQETGT